MREEISIFLEHISFMVAVLLFLVNKEANKVPHASDYVGDEDGDDVESQDLVNVQHQILGHDPLVSGAVVAHQRLDHLAELRDAKQLEQSGQPKEPD